MIALYIFFLSVSSVYGIGEKTISLGSAFSWELMEKRQGISEASLIRPYPVLVLDGTGKVPEALGDLYLSFDAERPLGFTDALRRYDVSVSPELGVVTAPWTRNGSGAALFSGKAGSGASESPLVLKPGRAALFASGSHVRDFSIEFWLYPRNLDTGEQVFLLSASKPDGRGGFIYQYISCTASKNKLHWNFGDFFFAPGDKKRMSLTLSGPPLLSRTWSHHLIRFDSDLGLLEYLVDGKLEAVDYATSTGREGGEVYTPVIGDDCRIELGGRFSGIMDEFSIYRGCIEKSTLAKYPSRGGRVETRTLDLGSAYSSLLKIEALGGRTSIPRSSIAAGNYRNEYAGSGSLRFQDHSEIKFYVRVSNSPYRWNDVPWIAFNPGTELQGNRFRGRYVQIASDFYPGWDGETSPYLSELRIIYNSAEAPPPPTQVVALAKNGAVELSWRASPSVDLGGYMVYYGDAKGEYFGNYAIIDSAARVSPINVGNRTKIRIEGLSNGVLYYFVVAAYNKPAVFGALPEPGEFSREAAARPLLQPAEDG